MNFDLFVKKVENWVVAISEMVIATTTFEAFFGHVATIFWGLLLTILIFFMNRFLNRKFGK